MTLFKMEKSRDCGVAQWKNACLAYRRLALPKSSVFLKFKECADFLGCAAKWLKCLPYKYEE